jgi:hypothetical protein
MATLQKAIKMLFDKYGQKYMAYTNGIVLMDCPKNKLPYIDNHSVDFNIMNINSETTIVYIKKENAYVVLLNENDNFIALDTAIATICNFKTNYLSARRFILY